MSTTTSPEVALDYAGGGGAQGTIFAIDFDMASRGADIQWLSQYPHEVELLFPPCTCLSTVDVYPGSRGLRCALLSANISTARPDTGKILLPTDAPGTDEWNQSLLWVAGVMKVSNRDALTMKHWNLSEKEVGPNIDDLTRLIGGGRIGVLRSIDLSNCSLKSGSVDALAEALARNSTLTAVDLLFNEFGDAQTQKLIGVLEAHKTLNSLCGITSETQVLQVPFEKESYKMVAATLRCNASIKRLRFFSRVLLENLDPDRLDTILSAMEHSCVVEFEYIAGQECKVTECHDDICIQPSADAIVAIKVLLESNTSLRVLKLEGFRNPSMVPPKVSTAEWEALLQAAKGRPQGFELHLDSTASCFVFAPLIGLPFCLGLPSACCSGARLWRASNRTGASVNRLWFCPCFETKYQMQIKFPTVQAPVTSEIERHA